jgi:hypothetical protein
VRLFFHLTDGREAVVDAEGVEVDHLDEARNVTLQTIAELRAEDRSAARKWAGWTLQIVDDSGALVLSLELDNLPY